jgi:hypothetical protein
MTPRATRIVGCLLLAGLLCGVAPVSLAEVSVVRWKATRNTGSLIASLAAIGEDADPIPRTDIRWEPVRSVSSNEILNSSGDVRTDGPPDVVYHESTYRPFVVWAYDNGPDHDIAFSQWTDSGWSTEQFLTFDAEDELDPRLFVGPDDEIHVVWWVDGPDPRVMWTSRATNLAAWEVPTRVSPSGETVRRPTVSVHQGVIRVAYERLPNVDPTGGRELVVRRLDADRGFIDEHVFSVPRADRLDAVLHVQSGRAWMDWKNSDTRFASAELVNSSWTAPTLHGWSDPSWVGVESMRKFIRRNLLVSADVVDHGP